ncbi:ribbon-helix-helix protein, CopG family [Halorubrum sp. CBA1125]|uniref:double zinc ribbon domain-containing protein n=1 Tax=Halorubrum sp. CBA1125 TaxID=2668072 RepID=UPI0012E70220|nr:zinc ribbon domain-containing protein [Halorubrum sp. CBA1125]MUW15111.1 ribbon-helix-helix protein, CopG family [Halorubrum sp. CBA1125]
MSKITFRADDDLVERLEACDASKSEVMREALRTHLDDAGEESDASDESVDAALAGRIDDLIADRLDELLDDRIDEAVAARLGDRTPPSAYTPENAGEINVNVTLDAPNADEDDARVTRETSSEPETNTRKTRPDPDVQTRENACGGCGENVPNDHVYCPNCGEKQSHRAFCECGDELRTDWAFCPGCGRRTPAADVLKD